MGNSKGANEVDGSDDCMKERGELLRWSVDEITRSIVGEIESSIISGGREEDKERNQCKLDQLISLVKNLSHRLEYVEKKQDALLSSKIQTIENEQESMKASMKVIEYLLYTKNGGSPERTNAVALDNENPVPTNLHKDKGKQIDNDCTLNERKKGVLIHEISNKLEHVGDEYNPDITFTLSDAEEDNVIIDESLSTPRPEKMQKTQFTAAELGKVQKTEQWDDLFGCNMLGSNDMYNPTEETPKKGVSAAKKRGRPSGSTSGKPKAPKSRLNSSYTRTSTLATLDKPKGHVFPPGVRGLFKPRPEFDLTWAEMRMALHVFNKDLDPREVLVKIGDESAKRRDLESLLPNNLIDEKLAALDDTPYETIVEEHAKPWMPFAYPLKVIYVPLLEGNVHWYLMVIDFYTKKVYKMDSFDSPHALSRKHAAMKRVCKLLEKIIASPEYAAEMFKTPHDFSSWEFKEVQGIPNMGNCKNSGVWLLDWLEMGDAFQTNIIGVLEEDKTRMQTAVKLVLGHYNEMKPTAESKTRTTWTNLPF
ncbi:hypothetical protein RIF29_26689 [Crotalaria pallida]|uniref:Ubiquitin-like protease family profile domain-containing protein n=1 Tax=Crotalaria pallida TaxID=3830 RepID=A0AAN9ENK2_CROPI